MSSMIILASDDAVKLALFCVETLSAPEKLFKQVFDELMDDQSKFRGCEFDEARRKREWDFFYPNGIQTIRSIVAQDLFLQINKLSDSQIKKKLEQVTDKKSSLERYEDIQEFLTEGIEDIVETKPEVPLISYRSVRAPSAQKKELARRLYGDPKIIEKIFNDIFNALVKDFEKTHEFKFKYEQIGFIRDKISQSSCESIKEIYIDSISQTLFCGLSYKEVEQRLEDQKLTKVIRFRYQYSIDRIAGYIQETVIDEVKVKVSPVISELIREQVVFD